MKNKKVVIPLSAFVLLLISFSAVSPKFFLNVFSGRVSFPDKYVGSILTMADGEKYTILRTLRVDINSNQTARPAVFIVRFKFQDLSLETNKILSMIPSPFLIGMEGFMEKIWVFNNDTGGFQGIYQWKSKEIAENYPESFIFKLMTKRAAPGSLSYEIKPDTDLSQYLKKRIF